jgi:hypothetical protein
MNVAAVVGDDEGVLMVDAFAAAEDGGWAATDLAVAGKGEGEGLDDLETSYSWGQGEARQLLDLPDELLVRVLASLPKLADASSAFAACHRLYSIYLDDHFWRYPLPLYRKLLFIINISYILLPLEKN